MLTLGKHKHERNPIKLNALLASPASTLVDDSAIILISDNAPIKLDAGGEMIAERLSSVSSAKGIKKRQCFRIPLGSRSSHLEQCECVRMDGWMLSLHTHADGWMQFSILCSPSREQLLRSPRAVITRCILRRADVSVTGSESAA